MESSENPPASASEDRRYRLLVDAIADYAIYMLDQHGIVTSWNLGALLFKGYAASEIIGQHFSRFYTDEDRAAGAPANALRTAAEQGRFENEGWRVRKDGTKFWAHVVIDPIKSGSGEIIGFAKITRDLTERRRAESALRQSEEQFRRLVQGVTDYAIYMLDIDGRVATWNAGAERIKGYRPDEIIGQHFSRFYTEEDRQAGLPQEGLAEAARKGRFEKEGLRVRKDGSRFIANIVIDAVYDDFGHLIGFAKVTRDITEKRKAQQALEQAQQALFQTQKLQAIGQLTGGIAHDFNNLLGAILASLELLQKRLPHDDQSLALLNNAIQGAERGSTLTKRMLAFARRQELKLQPIDLASLVGGMLALLDRSIGPDVTIKTRLPDGLPAVHGDAHQLESAFLNLAVNARDAMPDGGKIEILAREEVVDRRNPIGATHGRYVCVSVVDTGLGMDTETLSHAAEPFFTTKGVGKGTGLGLSMVHGLVEQSGGKLRITSRPGHGTTVEMWLPVSNLPLGVTPRATSRGAADQGGGSRPLVILVVDDDKLVLVSTSALLEDLGHTVIEAGDGMRALEFVANNPGIDVVLTDQAMPGMTGLELADAIRELRPGLPVILATGYTDLPEQTFPRIRKLTKPYRRIDLEDTLAAAAGSVADPV
ncbi:MAG TPA: PAS domain S-box protein [Rudaea sp.]|nr:PAS domain S-box protein [Rudaea sp.]